MCYRGGRDRPAEIFFSRSLAHDDRLEWEPLGDIEGRRAEAVASRALVALGQRSRAISAFAGGIGLTVSGLGRTMQRFEPAMRGASAPCLIWNDC